MHSPKQSECLYYSQFTGKVFNVCKRTVRPSHDDHDLFIIIIDLRVECPIESKSKRISMASTKTKKNSLSTWDSFSSVWTEKEEVYEALTGALLPRKEIIKYSFPVEFLKEEKNKKVLFFFFLKNKNGALKDDCV